jgi:hypothetical protein
MFFAGITAGEAAAGMRRHHAALCTDWGIP